MSDQYGQPGQTNDQPQVPADQGGVTTPPVEGPTNTPPAGEMPAEQPTPGEQPADGTEEPTNTGDQSPMGGGTPPAQG